MGSKRGPKSIESINDVFLPLCVKFQIIITMSSTLNLNENISWGLKGVQKDLKI